MGKTSRYRFSRPPAFVSMAAVGVLLGGCASPGDHSVAVPTIAPGVTSPAGTPLADGFVVAEGSVLIGEVYPNLRVLRSPAEMPSPTTGERSGWTAQLLVVGDPLAVFNDYVAQAGELGYPMDGGCSIDEAQSTSIPLADYDGDAGRLLRCAGEYYRSTDVEPIDVLRVAVEMFVGDLSGLPARHVNVSLTQVGDGSGDPEPFQNGPPLGPVSDRVPVLPVLDPPSLPAVGEPIAPELLSRTEVRVPVGSALAAIPSGGARCANGYDAVLVTADVGAALADLERQLDDLDSHPIEYLEVQREGVTFRSFSVDPIGDGHGIVTSAEGSPVSTILISAC